MTMPMTLTLARKAPRATRILGLGLLLALIILPFLALLPADHPLAISVWTLTLAGKILCYAIVAVALDLCGAMPACSRWDTVFSLRWEGMRWECT
jgi:urea transport system permease protein